MDVSEEWIAFGDRFVNHSPFFCIFEIVLQIPDCARPVVDSQQHRTGVFFNKIERSYAILCYIAILI